MTTLPPSEAEARLDRDTLEWAINQCEGEQLRWSDSAGLPAERCANRLRAKLATLPPQNSSGDARETLAQTCERLRAIIEPIVMEKGLTRAMAEARPLEAGEPWTENELIDALEAALSLSQDSSEGVGAGFDAAVAAIESWASGFTGPSDTANRLRLTAKDLRRNRDTILGSQDRPASGARLRKALEQIAALPLGRTGEAIEDIHHRLRTAKDTAIRALVDQEPSHVR